MKKQVLIFAITISAMVFVSCSKESIETKQPVNSEIAGIANQKGGSASLNKGLMARYEFNKNLDDMTGQLAPAVPSIAGAEVYTEDRNGIANKAIYFTGRYTLDVLNVPVQTKMSVTAWVKYSTDFFPLTHIVEGDGPTLSNENNKFLGLISTPGTTSVSSNPVDNNWHHLAATYDGTDLKFYVDGVFIGSSFNPSPIYTGFISDYHIGGWYLANAFWRGSMDDVRFYSKVLSPSEVQMLFNQ